MLSAAVWPWLAATSQCSRRSAAAVDRCSRTRRCRRRRRRPGAEVSSPDEQRSPPVSPSSSPAERASITSGDTPTPTTTRSQSSSRPELVTTFVTRPSGALEAVELVSPEQLHAVVLQHAVEEARDLLAELALERDVLEHHDRALDPVRGGERGGHLAADVAAADQHDPLGLLGIGADRVRVGRTRAGSGCRRGRSRPRAGDGRWRRWPASALPKPTVSLVDSVATRSAVSSFITLVRVSSSTPCSSHQPSGR